MYPPMIRYLLFGLVCAGLVLLTLVALANGLILHEAAPYLRTRAEAAGQNADCVLVLGARVYENGSLSPTLADRVSVGVELYHQGAGRVLLLSGDHGTAEYDEVNAMKAAALAAGVAKDHLFLDHAGFSTYDSLYRLKEVFGAKSVVIVTQSFHLSRALYIARRLGLEATGVASDLRRYSTQSKNELREFLARGKAWLYVHTWPKPKYLGAPISLKGSGTATWD